YDGFDRVLTRRAVDGRVTSYAYAGRGTDITEAFGTALARTKHVERDGLGRIVWTRDANQERVAFRNGPFNTVTGISEPGAADWGTVVVPDAYGRPTSVSDPDLGLTTNVYNAFGELVQSVDANQRSQERATTLYYDAVGRLVMRSDQDGITNFGYDTAEG